MVPPTSVPRVRCHMWVEFVVNPLLTPRVFLGVSLFVFLILCISPQRLTNCLNERYRAVLYKVVLTFKSVDETLVCDHYYT